MRPSLADAARVTRGMIEATTNSGIGWQIQFFCEFIDECMVCFKEAKWVLDSTSRPRRRG